MLPHEILRHTSIRALETWKDRIYYLCLCNGANLNKTLKTDQNWYVVWQKKKNVDLTNISCPKMLSSPLLPFYSKSVTREEHPNNLLDFLIQWKTWEVNKNSKDLYHSASNGQYWMKVCCILTWEIAANEISVLDCIYEIL